MLLYHSFGQEDLLSYCISYMNMLNFNFPGFEPIPRLSVTYDRSVVSPGTPVSSTNKTDRHHIAEILLKVVLNTIKQKKSILYKQHVKFYIL